MNERLTLSTRKRIRKNICGAAYEDGRWECRHFVYVYMWLSTRHSRQPVSFGDDLFRTRGLRSLVWLRQASPAELRPLGPLIAALAVLIAVGYVGCAHENDIGIGRWMFYPKSVSKRIEVPTKGGAYNLSFGQGHDLGLLLILQDIVAKIPKCRNMLRHAKMVRTRGLPALDAFCSSVAR